MTHPSTRSLRALFFLELIAVCTAAAGAQAPAPAPDQTGYLFGLTFGEQMNRVGITDEVRSEAVARGIQDGLKGKKTTPADRQALDAFVRMVVAAATQKNQAAAKEFLTRNGREKGVATTASGLQYRILAAGDRKAPPIAATDEVSVQYRGTLLDGSEFDSTYTRGAPVSFAVNSVIPGWQEALVMMKPGAHWQLFVPPELGYGTGPKPGIPGGSLLIFDVDVLGVNANRPSPAPPVKSPPAAK